MRIIKLNATDSTNLYLKDLMNESSLDDFTFVVADTQTLGRGQMGTVWESEHGKNLTFSVLKKMESEQFNNPFLLNICISLAVYNALRTLGIPNLKVKWPNDILSGHSKICGILIENILSGSRMISSVIGIGLNVNQEKFIGLPNVSSLKLIMGKAFDLEMLLFLFYGELKKSFLEIENKGAGYMKDTYESVLFRKDKPSTFKGTDGHLFMGFIRGVSDQGKLMVTLEDDIQKEFNMKEISLLY
ncbi:biotin--[acetyl-CoA-carboxylase] ligase [Maribacter sp. ANRC-HE7]|uniref:Biotin--[acetyl-CoA-carboxylase] ligase n=1 Tax=Maribacter aquimaris TaxID=2737171 RepID=A0ABR7V4U9_9FLAO|nr:biotin--[acetyl-CoA-carboxylase] ligase [Maribacter aquimaris]MBD0779814.1 biotin--[acetyl-CoA-carboxylase] ligase [Maribacter aquimaris]